MAFWQSGRDVDLLREADGIIIASAPHTHAALAEYYIKNFVPVLIEKPVAMEVWDAQNIVDFAKEYDGIVFAGHTRLYSNAWRRFRDEAKARGVYSVYATAGGHGSSSGQIDALWDWGPHLVAMCSDIGFDPRRAHIVVTDEEAPLEFFVNGEMRFRDVAETPTPLQVLLGEFMDAIKKGEPDARGAELALEVTEVLEESHKAHAEMKRDAEKMAHRDRQPAGTVWH